MNITSFGEKYNKKTIMCLGAFDSIHKGHKKIINKALELENKYNAKACVFTYYNDLSGLTKKSEGLVFTFSERMKRLKELGVEEVCACEFNSEFASQSADEFLRKIVDNRPIGAFICGKDFRFGKKAQGNIEYLKMFCEKSNIDVYVCDFENDEETGEKISTTKIKELLSLGKIEKANKLLGDRYFISGKIVEGRKQGRTIGFPTANINFESDKYIIMNGVYATTIFIDGICYRGITNVGIAPTFNFNKVVVETYIDNFNGDLYGKELVVYFDKLIRNIKRFDGVEQLKRQLNSDLQEIR